MPGGSNVACPSGPSIARCMAFLATFRACLGDARSRLGLLPAPHRPPTMSPSHVFKYMDVVATDQKHLCAAKLYIWSEPMLSTGARVTWQLRDFVLCLGYQGRFYLHEWLKATKKKRGALCKFFGLSADEIIPSRKAVVQSDRAGTGYEVNEWGITTRLLLFDMLSWTSWMQGRRARVAEEVFAVCLLSCVGDCVGEIIIVPPERKEMCQPDKNNSAWCVHARQVLRLGHHRFLELMRELFVLSQRCLVCLAWMKSLARQLVAVMDKQVMCMQLPHLPLGFPIHRGQKRARRVDEVMRSVSSLAGCTEKKRRLDSHCRPAPTTVMKNYLHGGSEHFSDIKQLSINCDGSTVARKDTWVCAAYDPKENLAMWLPVQVSIGSPPGSRIRYESRHGSAHQYGVFAMCMNKQPLGWGVGPPESEHFEYQGPLFITRCSGVFLSGALLGEQRA